MTAGNGMEIHAHNPRTPERSEALWHQGLAGPTLGPVLADFKSCYSHWRHITSAAVLACGVGKCMMSGNFTH